MGINSSKFSNVDVEKNGLRYSVKKFNVSLQRKDGKITRPFIGISQNDLFCDQDQILKLKSDQTDGIVVTNAVKRLTSTNSRPQKNMASSPRLAIKVKNILELRQGSMPM